MSDTELLVTDEPTSMPCRVLQQRWWRRVTHRLLSTVNKEPWRSTALGAGLFALLGVAYWAIAPRKYRGHAIVAPASHSSNLSRLPGTLSGLAGQFGLTADLDPTITPAFYSLVGQSESLKRQVLFSILPPRRGERVGRPVWRALGIPACDSVCIVREGLPKLDNVVDITVNRQTGTFEIAAVLRDPTEAAAVANLYIAALDRFNRSVRRTQMRASRQFLEGRVASVTADLHAAENALQSFYERNANWQQSPRLSFEEGRLRREVEAQDELRSALLRQLEWARLEEVNSTPLLSVIDSAMPPTRKYSPRGRPILIGTLVAGGLLGLAIGVANMRPSPNTAA